MNIIGKLLAKGAIILVETMAVTAANYATATAIDIYAHPDLKDCATDEEKQAKIQKFEKTMSVVKPAACVIEAGLFAAGASLACDAIDRSSNTATAAKEESNTNEASGLIGCNYYM